MSIIEIIILGLALSMDAFAVSLSNLMAYPHLSKPKKIALPLTFGIFQGLMPLLGFLVGSLAAQTIDAIAGPLALVLLGFIGGKMIFEAFANMRAAQKEKDSKVLGSDTPSSDMTNKNSPSAEPSHMSNKESKTLSYSAILLQGIATSLDALIVGISFLALKVNIVFASSVIAITTFACCAVALIIGKKLGALLGDKAQVIGGIVLIAIGIKACFF